MEEADKGWLMTTIGVSRWMFLLVPAHPGCPDKFHRAVKRLCVNWFSFFSYSFSLFYFSVTVIQFVVTVNLNNAGYLPCYLLHFSLPVKWLEKNSGDHKYFDSFKTVFWFIVVIVIYYVVFIMWSTTRCWLVKIQWRRSPLKQFLLLVVAT